jgi:protein phosphatase
MLTIGAFAKACRLWPKALRLYDELELLRPARADPDTGYRYYAVAQLERARPVAWLRRLGMPLPEIRTVCALVPPRTGAAVRAYWARVAAETAVRRDLVPRQAMSARQGAASGACSGVPHARRAWGSAGRKPSYWTYLGFRPVRRECVPGLATGRTLPAAALAAFLVDQSTATPRKDTTMLELRCFAHSDRGRVRPANQDTAHADARLLAVADGYGPAGGTASSAAVKALKVLDARGVPAGSVLNVLQEAVEGATAAVREVAGGSAEEAGTTLTAMLWTARSWPSSTSGTRAPTCCATGRCSGSPTTTPWCSR